MSRNFFEQYNINKSFFAQHVGVSREVLYRYIRGETIKPITEEKIEKGILYFKTKMALKEKYLKQRRTVVDEQTDREILGEYYDIYKEIVDRKRQEKSSHEES